MIADVRELIRLGHKARVVPIHGPERCVLVMEGTRDVPVDGHILQSVVMQRRNCAPCVYDNMARRT
jgi:hypothetical protein